VLLFIGELLLLCRVYSSNIWLLSDYDKTEICHSMQFVTIQLDR